MLHPKRDFSGKRRYSTAELDEFRARSARPRVSPAPRPRPEIDGAVAAAAFAMLAADRGLRDVVLELKIRPDDAADLRRRYVEFGAEMLLGPAELDELRELLVWQGTTSRSLVAAVKKELRRHYEIGLEVGAQKPDEDETHSEEGKKVNGEREKIHTGS